MSRRAVEVRAAARDDLAAHYRYLLREAGPDVAEAMLTGADRAFARLAANPALGPAAGVDDLRKWRVAGFPRLLIFYRAQDEVLAVIRVLHAARDLPPLLEP